MSNYCSTQPWPAYFRQLPFDLTLAEAFHVPVCKTLCSHQQLYLGSFFIVQVSSSCNSREHLQVQKFGKFLEVGSFRLR